jgi:hypothetical protein
MAGHPSAKKACLFQSKKCFQKTKKKLTKKKKLSLLELASIGVATSHVKNAQLIR